MNPCFCYNVKTKAQQNHINQHVCLYQDSMCAQMKINLLVGKPAITQTCFTMMPKQDTFGLISWTLHQQSMIKMAKADRGKLTQQSTEAVNLQVRAP